MLLRARIVLSRWISEGVELNTKRTKKKTECEAAKRPNEREKNGAIYEINSRRSSNFITPNNFEAI